MNQIARALLLLACIAGCNDIYAYPVVYADPSEFDDGDASAPGVLPSSTGQTAVTCPTQRPYDGQACNGSPACEYGTNVDSWCNTHVECDGSTITWSTIHEPDTCNACPPGSDVIEGASCGDDSDAGVDAGGGRSDADRLCGYPTRTCACAVRGGRRQWFCAPISTDCPTTRPLEGHACDVQQTCDYGACLGGLGRAMTCDGTVWVVATTQCD